MVDLKLFHAVARGVASPASLGKNAVIGCIKWDRSMGLPDGKLVDAFLIKSYHWQRIEFPPLTKHFKLVVVPHPPVEKTEGTHDSHHCRVMFWTLSEEPTGYEDKETAEEEAKRHINVVEVILNPASMWPNNTFTGEGHKVVIPARLNYNPPGNPQRLVDFLVLHKPLPAYG
jgi:hypothetical protein